MSQSILIAEDEAISLKHLTYALQKEGYAVTGARHGIEAFSLFEKNPYDVIIADIKMPGMDGLTLLEKIKEKDPDMDVIVITGFGSIESAVDSMKKGASEYITKPFNSDHIKMVVKKSEERREYQRLAQEREFYKVLSSIDGLTELYDYRYMHQYLKLELEREKRYKRHLSLLMIDIARAFS